MNRPAPRPGTERAERRAPDGEGRDMDRGAGTSAGTDADMGAGVDVRDGDVWGGDVRETVPGDRCAEPRAELGAEPNAEPGAVRVPRGVALVGAPAAVPLPDLLTLDLAELGSVDHPVLREVLGELRARAAEPSEMLWGFDNSF